MSKKDILNVICLMYKLFLIQCLGLLVGLAFIHHDGVCASVVVSKTSGHPRIEDPRLLRHLQEVKAFMSQNHKYNPNLCFLIDMALPSGKNRFFVCDIPCQKILDQGLVAHGYGSETDVEGVLKFSNIEHSNMTSLGNYSVGPSYIGQFGKAYRLHGLDATNSNAYKRYIVLHQFSDVPYHEQDQPIANSLGCPMVNAIFFKRIAKRIDASPQSIILYIYY